jgi:hypothetical protein
VDSETLIPHFLTRSSSGPVRVTFTGIDDPETTCDVFLLLSTLGHDLSLTLPERLFESLAVKWSPTWSRAHTCMQRR